MITALARWAKGDSQQFYVLIGLALAVTGSAPPRANAITKAS